MPEEVVREKKAETEKTGEPKKAKVPAKAPVKKERKKKASWWKDITLGVVNLIFIILLVILLGRLPQKAIELAGLRREKLEAETKSRIEISEFEIASSKEKKDKLMALFPDEPGLVEFIKEIEKLKAEGVVTAFSFTSPKPVRDRTGFFGVPAVVEFTGSWSQIDTDLQKLHGLPFLFRAIVVEADQLEEGVINLKYGIFIYVHESLAKS